MNIMTRHQPDGWKLRSLGQVFAERKEKGSDRDFPALSVTMNGIVPQLETAAKTDRGDDRKVVRVGDYVINSRSDRKGSGGISNLEGSVSLISIVMKPTDIESKFAHHLLRSVAFQEEFYRFGRGIVADLWSTRFDDLKRIQVYLPPNEQQARIASALDRETARIDALIEKKTRFIELLKEKRQALLHDCLMHPDTIRMRVERCTESPTRPIDRDDEVSYTRLGLYNRGRGIFHKPEAIGRELGDSSFTWVHEGDLIVSGQFAWEGAVSLASNDEHGCVISHRYHTYRGKHDVTDTAYLWAYFTSHEGDFVLNDHSRGSAGRNRPLNPNTLAKEKIPVPPMVMQKRVAALVEFENRFKALVARSIVLLNERRSALITGAVTGQLDLRENTA